MKTAAPKLPVNSCSEYICRMESGAYAERCQRQRLMSETPAPKISGRYVVSLTISLCSGELVAATVQRKTVQMNRMAENRLLFTSSSVSSTFTVCALVIE